MSSFIGFDMESTPEKKKSTDMKKLSELFGGTPLPNTGSGIVILPIASLSDRKNHRWEPLSGEEEKKIEESIKRYGVIEPIIVRPREDILGYTIDTEYEILAGHNRVRLARRNGITTVPAIVVRGLTEAEAEQYVNHTNFGRSWEDMSYSARAAVIAAEYDAEREINVRKEVLDDINYYLKLCENLDESMAETTLSHRETKTVREVAKEQKSSPATIARYVRVNSLDDELKELLDNGMISLLAAVQLSYLSLENQEQLASIIRVNDLKCDEKQGKRMHEMQKAGKLDYISMTDVLTGKKKIRKAGRPKDFKISNKIIRTYFSDEEDPKKIGESIEEALKFYFENRGKLDTDSEEIEYVED